MPNTAGNWALWSLVCVFLICSTSFCCAFATGIMALMGRFASPLRRKTGLWELLAVTALCIPSLILFSVLENTYAAMVTFRFSSALQLLLLLAQLLLLIRGVNLQRRQK